MAEPLRLAAPGERAEPLMRVAQRRVGYLRAGKVMAFMIAWGVARETTEGFDELPATEQMRAYIDYWRAKERTAWGELAYFREAFPGEDTPTRLLDLLELHRAANVGALPVVVG